MVDRRLFIRTLSAAGLLAAIFPLASRSQSFAATVIAALDKDADGTLDLDEVKNAAGGTFDKLEKDADGTLDLKEIGGRLSKKEFNQADADHDRTLSKEEYLAVVDKRFAVADADKDGTLTGQELRSKAGRGLLRLIR